MGRKHFGLDGSGRYSIIPIHHNGVMTENEPQTAREKDMRTITLNIGTKRENVVCDNTETLTLDDIDREFERLVNVYEGALLRSIKMVPVTSEWGKEWTIVAVIEATPAGRCCNGVNLSTIATIFFDQEAVAYKEWDNDGEWRTLVDSGLTYHVNYPAKAKRYEFDGAYFIEAETRN